MTLWFEEIEQIEGGIAKVGYTVDKILFSEVSPFQKVEVVETKAFGRLLTLDGCTMVTDKDEFVYHEMISHLPICMHKNPKSVLVIGGGDGGTIREIVKHSTIEKAVLCEIDEVVIRACKEFFPEVSSALTKKNVTVACGDGVKFLERAKDGEYDIIVVDSTDPIGIAEGLFSEGFYKQVQRVLGNTGIMVCQSESPWFSEKMLGKLHRQLKNVFKYSHSYCGPVPTYPRGFWSWTMASQSPLDRKNFNVERFMAVKDSLQFLTLGQIEGIFDPPKFFVNKIK